MEELKNILNTTDYLFIASNDLEGQYPCGPEPHILATGMTQLMKLVLMTSVYSDINQHLKHFKETINHKNSLGWTALAIACCSSNIKSSNDTVKTLISLGADRSINDGKTSLMLACQYSGIYSNVETIQLLLTGYGGIDLTDNSNKYTALNYACTNLRTSNIETIIMLREYGANLSICDINGNIPLSNLIHLNPSSSVIDTVRFMLEESSPVNTINNQGNTPLIHACKQSNIEIINMLIEKGANVNVINKLGETPFTITVSSCHTDENAEILKLLLKAGANPDPTFKNIAPANMVETITQIILDHIGERDVLTENSKVPECIICQTNLPAYYAKPCHHVLYCYSCYFMIEDDSKCTLCRKKVDEYCKVLFV
jgi:ankyrin repeat protein